MGKERIADLLKEMIYPSGLYCICCGNIIDNSRSYSLCDYCMTHIHWDVGSPMVYRGNEMISCVEYGIFERSIIFALKYDNHRYIADNIAEIMRDRLESSGWWDDLDKSLVVPVPLSKERYGERGYNQSELIADKLAGRLKRDELQVELADALIRTRDTKPMKSLGPVERFNNIAGSIEVKPEYGNIIRGRKVILIDDFFTTGSTALECSKALRKGGATGVRTLAFASRKRNDVI